MMKQPRFKRYIQLKTKEHCIACEYSLIMSKKLSCMKVQLHTGVEVDVKCVAKASREEKLFICFKCWNNHDFQDIFN